MDPRIREHAEVLVDWSARIEAGDTVVVSAGPEAHEFAVAVAEKLGEVGAQFLVEYRSGEVSSAYATNFEGEWTENALKRSLYEEMDAWLRLGGGRNAAESSAIPPETVRAATAANRDLQEVRLASDWVGTHHPTRAAAQQAGMSVRNYRDFVYGAILRDWESLAAEMAQLKDLLDDGTEVHLWKADDPTDLTMRIDDRTAVNSAASVDYDSHNLPSGEVFTAPFAAEGEIVFDVPLLVRGTQTKDVHLVFEGGEVVDYSAAQGESVIQDIVETDEGARRLGELGVGMNRGIDRVTNNLLFDEKMAGTVHLALGRAYDSNVPEGETGNQSVVHVDLVTDMRTDSEFRIDGDVIQRSGYFRWEDEFDA
jgi:aminopeptidase